MKTLLSLGFSLMVCFVLGQGTDAFDLPGGMQRAIVLEPGSIMVTGAIANQAFSSSDVWYVSKSADRGDFLQELRAGLFNGVELSVRSYQRRLLSGDMWEFYEAEELNRRYAPYLDADFRFQLAKDKGILKGMSLMLGLGGVKLFEVERQVLIPRLTYCVELGKNRWSARVNLNFAHGLYYSQVIRPLFQVMGGYKVYNNLELMATYEVIQAWTHESDGNGVLGGLRYANDRVQVYVAYGQRYIDNRFNIGTFSAGCSYLLFK